ncbi:MAG: Asp-tRNA(Asn)/Glu-tRNA(Gln) amidotransferase subunit GatA [Syntrophomonadaceae bacterium]|nr:Asp-tRNA(Asn)/Glu-tRNA(Gln) amidotransferase subunit GatA [Syntrophomonadaceae bacterium]
MSLYSLPLYQLHAMLIKQEVSAKEITEAFISRIDEVESHVRAFITITTETALAKAMEVDRRLAAGEGISPLAGIPMGLKDNLCTKGILTTCGSKILENFIPPYDATVVSRLAQRGAVLIGKLNMDEFAMGSSNETSRFFPTRNPWDLNRVPGGSSGGPAAAVAAGEVAFSLGTDTGGSIRQPASFCGIVGMKPTYGLVSRYGAVAYASSLDQIGPMTKNVTDCALVLQEIAGQDPLDSTSVGYMPPNYRKALVNDIKGLRIGIPKEYFVAGLEPGVKKAVEAAIAKLEELGAVCKEVSLPHTEYALAAYYIISPAEASSNLAKFDGVSYGFRNTAASDVMEMYMKTRREGFGPEVKRRIMLGTYALSAGYYDAYYLKALKVRTLVKQDFARAFEHVDVLAAPTAPMVAFKLGERIEDPLAMYLIDTFTIPVNMAGVPGISIPCGLSEGMPVGLQLIGKPFSEALLFRVAYTYEQNTSYHLAKPALEVN